MKRKPKRFIDLNALAIRANESQSVVLQYQPKEGLRSRLKKLGLVFNLSWSWKSGTFAVLPAILITVRKGDSSIAYGPKYTIDFYFFTVCFSMRSRVWGVAG